MNRRLSFDIIEKKVEKDRNFVYTIISYSAILAIFINLNSLKSPLVGLIASTVFSLINTVFLGNAFLKKETLLLKLTLGALLFIMVLGFIGWLIMIIYNLDVAEFTLVLVVTATFSSVLNRRVKHKNATS
jgi:hypothetical protein